MADAKLLGFLRQELGRNPAHKRADEIAAAIVAECAPFGFDPLLVLALIYIESAYKADAVSNCGARGLMQLMPTTAAEIARKADIPYMDGDEFDPLKNVALGVRYLAQMYGKYRSWWPNALTAYNRGPNATDKLLVKYDGVVPHITLDSYAHLILRKWYGFVKALEVVGSGGH